MTAPAPSPAEQAVIERFGIFEPEARIRYRLIEALECSDIDLRIADIARDLLPVVDRIANERAAAALEAAAKAKVVASVEHFREILRAAALRAGNGEGT